MSAAEIIREIEALPPAERAKVIAYSDQARLKGAKSPQSAGKKRAFAEAKSAVFSKHQRLLEELSK